MGPPPPDSPPALSILSLLPRPPNPHTALYSKILASSGGSSITIADSTLSDFDPEHRPCAHASCNDFAAHEILWDHFGFIPPHPDLVLDGYKPPSPLPSPKVRPRHLSVTLSLSRTSPSILSPSLPKMAKKRRSLQSILVPSFLPQASTSASAIETPPPRARSHTVTSSSDLSGVECSDWLSFYSGASSPIVPATPSRNSPPPDLLDDDPFANRSPAPSLRGSRATSPVRTVFDIFADGPQASLPPPRSPLAPPNGLPEDGSRVLRHASSYSSFQGLANAPSAPPPTPTEPSTPLLRRPKSSGPPQVRPAYTRPAFAPRPSLPSLNTLARTSIHVPKARKGRPGAHLPLEPWEDSAPSAPSEPPSPTWSLRNSPIARRRGHLRRPTLSMIRDSRMYLDGENAEDGGVEDGGIPPLEPEDKEPSSACTTPMPIAEPRDRDDFGMGTSFLSISPEEHRGSFEDDLEHPPTPPPKSPGLAWHTRSVSQTSATSTSTVPSLCPSSPTSSVFTESHLRPQSSSSSHGKRASSLQPSSPPQPTHLHPHVHVDTDRSGPSSYPAVFAHQRHTQFLTSDLLASLEYDYSDAVTRLDAATPMGLTVPRSPSALFPSGDFEPGSSAGTIRNVPQARIQVDAHEEPPRPLSDSSAESKSSNEAVDAHGSSPQFLGVPLSPLSPPELPSSSSEPSAESSPARSPCTTLSRSSSFSTVSSEYDFGEDEYVYQYGYSYDVGSFADPLASPSADARPVFGYGIPWPSTHRTSSGSGSGGSGSGGSMSDVLSDLEDLAEDLTERFSLSAGASSICGDGDVFSDGGSLADAPEGEAGSRRSGRPSGGSSQGGTSYNSHDTSNGYGNARNGGGGFRRGSAGAGGDEGDDDDDRKRRPARLPISARAAVTDSETSEDDDDEDESDYGEASPQRRPRERHDTTRPGMLASANAPSPTTPSSAHPDTATDDDVPLARQIPTALKAQRTIRRQVRDELDQKREERRAQRAQHALLTQQQQQPQSRVPSSTINAAFAAPAPPLATGSSPPRATARPRTKTLPSTMGSPFSVGDLTKKLLGLQGASSATPASPAPVSPMFPQSKRPSLDREPQQPYGSASAGPSLRGRTNTMDANTYQSASRQASRPPAPEASRGLRPMRSFHRPRAGDADAMLSMPPMPVPERTSQSELQRRATGTSRHRPDEPPAFLATAPPAPVPVPSSSVLDRARSVRSGKSSRRPSTERRSELEGPSPVSRARAATLSSQAQPAPAPAQPPASTFSQPGKAGGQMMWQQRVFIGNMQRFCQVEIGSGTGAGDVLAMVDAQGALEQGAGSGGWMLWEVSQDFGMERPIRSFELLSDVCGSWNTDKTVNFLVIKKTLLAPLLSPKAMPSASPKCSGYVQFEYKRGKWQKRWMELREHSLWLSKRDTGKDATFLCSLNNFDAYYVTRVHKAPKPYVFSVKSTDSLAFFESTADYVHVFSCGESEGKNWLEKILLARSYVLYQERNVLSSTTAPGSAPGATAGGLQRAGTRKPGQRPAQPLMTVDPPKVDQMVAPSGFEPAAGSLLARRH